MARVGIFGGSFDPVHEGHIHLAELARQAMKLDEVWFLPCRISPHKMNLPPSAPEERVRWLELALGGLPWARVETIELEAEGGSFSYQTLEKLAERGAGNEWFWILGGDQWEALPRWRHPERISALAEFVVLGRGGAAVTGREGYRLNVIEGGHPASSTEIRRALAAGDVGIQYLDPAVERAMAEGG